MNLTKNTTPPQSDRELRDEQALSAFAEILESQAALALGDAQTRAATLFELGELYADKLGRLDAARDAFGRAFQTDPARVETIGKLEALYAQAENWEALCALLEAAAAATPARNRKADLLCKLGEIFDERFGEPERATDSFKRALVVFPQHLGAIRGLQRIAVGDEDDEAAITAYTREGISSRDPLRIAFLSYEIATRLEANGDSDNALRWWERRLEVVPKDRDALDACARIYETRADTAGLCHTLERLLPLCHQQERALITLRLGQAYKESERSDEAIRCYCELVENDPLDLENWWQLSSLYARTEKFEAQAETLGKIVALETDEAQSLAARRRLAALLEESLGDPDGALAVLLELPQEGSPPDLAEDVERLFSKTGRTEDLAEWLRDRYQWVATTAAESKTLGLRLAALLGEEAGRWDEAATLYRELAEAHPEDPLLAPRVESALRAAGDQRGLVEYLRQQVQAEPDPLQRCKRKFELVSTLCDLDSSDVEIEELLTDLSDQAPDEAIANSATSMLCDRLERGQRWEGLYQRLLCSLEQTQNPEEIVEILERCFQLCLQHRRDSETARTHLEEALHFAPTRTDLWQQLASLAQSTGHIEALVSALEGELETRPGRERAICLHAQAAALCSQQLQDQERARAHIERLLLLDPLHLDAIEWMAEHLRKKEGERAQIEFLVPSIDALLGQPSATDEEHRGRKERLLLALTALLGQSDPEANSGKRLLERAIACWGTSPGLANSLVKIYLVLGDREAVAKLCRAVLARYPDPALQAQWNTQLGETLEALGETQGAIGAYREACRLRPGAQTPLLALENLHRNNGEREALARLLEARLESTLGIEEIPIRLELANLFGTGPLEDSPQAFVHLKRALELDENSRSALEQGTALAAKSRHAEWEIFFLDRSLRHAENSSEKIEILLRKSDLLAEQLERGQEAIAPLRRAFAMSPSSEKITERLAVSYRKLGQFEELLTLIHRVATQNTGDERSRWLSEAVAISREHAPAQTLVWLERLRRERPEDIAVQLEIADQHRRAGRSSALLRSLDEASLLALSPEQRTALVLERVELLETVLCAPMQALKRIRQARADGLEANEILHAQAKLAEKLGFHREALESLETLCTRSEGVERKELESRAAQICTSQLSDPSRAAEHLYEALGLDEVTGPERLELLRRLGNALREAGRTPAWLEVAEEELQSLDPDDAVFAERRMFLHFQIGQAYRLELSDSESALRHFRQLREELEGIDSPSEQRSGSLLAPNCFDPAEVKSILLGLLRSTGARTELAAHLQNRLENTPEAPDEWLELGQLAEEALHQPSLAKAAYQQVLIRWPDSKIALRGLRRIAEQLGDWGRVASTLEDEIALLPPEDFERRALFFRRIGEIAWRKLESTTRASRAFAAALEANPNDLLSLHALEELFEAMEDWRGAVDFYASEIEQLGDSEPSRRREVWLTIARIASDHLLDSVRARHALEAANKLSELTPIDCAHLALLYDAEGNRVRFIEFYTKWCDADAGASIADQLRLADALQATGALDEALSYLHRAHKREYCDELSRSEIWLAIAGIHEQREEWGDAGQARASAADHLPPAQAVAHLIQASKGIKTSDPEQAVQWLERAIEIDPASSSAQIELAHVADSIDDPERAIAAALRALDLDQEEGAQSDESRLDLMRLGAKSAQILGDLATASELYRTALERAPDDTKLLELYAAILVASGEFREAGRILETAVALPLSDSDRARAFAELGSCVERSNELPRAIECFTQALEADASNATALEGLVRIYEAMGDDDSALDLLEMQTERLSVNPNQQAACLLRIARIKRARGDEPGEIEPRLRAAIAAHPDLSGAWIALAELLVELEQYEELSSIARDGLEHAQVPEERGVLSHLLGVALEQTQQLLAAAEAYAQAQAEDSTRISDAIACARIYRALGDWTRSGAVLERTSQAIDEQSPRRFAAQLFLQLGRLRAGPLEDIKGAVEAYRTSLNFDPELRQGSEALAQILVHDPASWKEAIARHHDLLGEEPTQEASLYAVVNILRQRRRSSGVCDGLAILRALGVLSPRDRDEAPETVSLRVGRSHAFDNPVWERARKVLCATREEIAKALDVRNQHAPQPQTEASADPEAAFRLAALNAEGELAAPALVLLDDEEVHSVLHLVCSLGLGAEHVEGDGALVNALSESLTRRTQRRIRQLLSNSSLAEIDAIDIPAWRRALRDQANAQALDQCSGNLRAALRVLVRDSVESEFTEIHGDLRAPVQACPAATVLLDKVIRRWLDQAKRG